MNFCLISASHYKSFILLYVDLTCSDFDSLCAKRLKRNKFKQENFEDIP